MLGRIEALGETSPEVQNDASLLRLFTPILKVWSAKNAFAMSQEAMEAFGGQGYMEETGIGRAMRDVLVNTIWEGTSNVLSLDVLRVMAETKGQAMQLYSDVSPKERWVSIYVLICKTCICVKLTHSLLI